MHEQLPLPRELLQTSVISHKTHTQMKAHRLHLRGAASSAAKMAPFKFAFTTEILIIFRKNPSFLFTTLLAVGESSCCFLIDGAAAKLEQKAE